MQFEKNYDRKAMVEMEANGGYDTEVGADYADKYIQREKYFAGEILDVPLLMQEQREKRKQARKVVLITHRS